MFQRQRATFVAAGPRTPPPAASPQTTEMGKPRADSHRCIAAELWEEHTEPEQGQPRGVLILTMSDSFILMVILLTASVALLNIFSIPAPLRVWVPTALGSYKETEKFSLPRDKSSLASSHHSGIILPCGSLGRQGSSAHSNTRTTATAKE